MTVKALKTVLGVVAILLILGIAGRSDYNNEVIYSMRDGVYQALVDSLGHDASETKIVDTYMSNRDFWDKQGN